MSSLYFEVCLKGGAPWGFRLTGGKEFRTSLRVSKVTFYLPLLIHCNFWLPPDLLLELMASQRVNCYQVGVAISRLCSYLFLSSSLSSTVSHYPSKSYSARPNSVDELTIKFDIDPVWYTILWNKTIMFAYVKNI